MKSKEKKIECCEKCFKWGGQYGEYIHPCNNMNCECHTQKTPIEWEKEFDDKFVSKGTHGGWDEWRSWFRDRTNDDRQIENIKLFISSLLQKQIEEVRELISYTEHDNRCILSGASAGRPTENGGYEVKYGGKWYQTRPVNKKPKCECGLSDLLKELEKHG